MDEANGKNNGAAINSGFEEDGSESLQCKKTTKYGQRLSLTPLLKPLGSANPTTGRTTKCGIDEEKKKKEKSHTISVTDKRTKEVTKTQKCKVQQATVQGNCREVETIQEEKTQTTSFKQQKKIKTSQHPPEPRLQMSVVSSMIHDLQREDTLIKEPVSSATQNPKRGNSKEQLFQREVRSASVSVSVVTSTEVQTLSGSEIARRFGMQTKKRNSEMLLTGIGNTGGCFLEENQTNSSNNHHLNRPSKLKDIESQKQNSGTVNAETDLEKSQSTTPDATTKDTSCCCLWQPSLSNNKIKKSSDGKDEESQNKQNNSALEGQDKGKKGKGSILCRWKKKITKRKILAFICPCFTYYILEDKKQNNNNDDDDTKADAKSLQEKRDSRFERDMQMSQALCILISQLLFLAGAEARDNMVGCAVVAILMNYLQLVALCWLVVQALYLFSFTRKTDNESKRRTKTNLYYAGAWGFPLCMVVILAFKYESYSKHPHCWISFSDALSWSVATPVITLGLVQVILIILLVKALFTYRRSDNAEDNEYKKNVIKSGLKTVVCITITVLLTWLLGSLSLNIDKSVYHTFFSVFNALQGCAFFVFYVVLNPEVRLLFVTLWEWKNSAVTPFDDHEGIEIEDEEDKDKKKDKGGKKKSNAKGENSKQEDSMDSSRTVPEAEMVNVLPLTDNSTRSRDINVVNPSDKKGKITESGAGAKKKKVVINEPKKLVTTETEGCRRQGNPQRMAPISSSQAKAANFPFPSKDGYLQPSSQRAQSGTPSGQATKFEFKDNIPGSAISQRSSSPVIGSRPPHHKLEALSCQLSQSPRLVKAKNHKPRGKKKIAKGQSSVLT